ncbi:MAG: glycosyltransferase [Acidobacteriota bacterium]
MAYATPSATLPTPAPGEARLATPVVIAGMHRSGTSLITSWLSEMGLEVGADLLPADRHNPRGYFEDQAFLALNRRLVAACCDSDDGGHLDWGWTEGESFNEAGLEAFVDDGRCVVEALGPRRGPWGFKDPRNTLLLDFWHGLLDGARFVLIYRPPWEVADSMQRLGAEVFLRRPDYAARIWSFYNRRLLDFYRRHREKCVLISARAVQENPGALYGLLREKLGLNLQEVPWTDVYAEGLLQDVAEDDPLPRLFEVAYPETVSVLAELDASADLRPRSLVGDRARALEPFRFSPTPEAPEAPLAVVIPCRNDGRWLIEAVASVERVVPRPYDLVIVDDGSDAPPTVEILDRLEAAGYRIARQRPKGVCAARNLGFELARAEYIIPLDSDNRLRPGLFLAEAIAELDAHPQLAAVYGDRYDFGLREGRQAAAEFDLDRMLRGNYIDTCAVIRYSAWIDVGGYDEKLQTLEDWELWIRFVRRGWEIKHLPHVAFDYRVRPGSLVTTIEDPQVRKDILDRVLSNHREAFEDFFVRQLGHTLGAWPFLLLEERSQGRRGVTSGPMDLELARARLAAAEAARRADAADWRFEHAKASAVSFEQSAQQLRDTLAARDEVVKWQQVVLDEVRGRAELAEAAHRNVKREAAEREEKLRRLERAYQEALRDLATLRESAPSGRGDSETVPNPGGSTGRADLSRGSSS